METSAAEVENLAHAYGDLPAPLRTGFSWARQAGRPALAGVSFSVPRGSCFGLLGPNGSGKTTLFRILSTLMPPARGQARIFGKDCRSEADQVRRSIGVVFQSPGLDKQLTVAENLRYQGRLYGLGGGELRTRMDGLLERFNLRDRAGDLAETLSGGLRRRVELAKGLLHEPKLLVMDEPTAAIDPGARAELWSALEDLKRREGLTILFTTHSMEEAERCDAIAILDEGRLIARGSPEELKREIGGDVVIFSVRDPQPFREELLTRFGLNARIVGNQVRVEHPDGPAIASKVYGALADRIGSVQIGKPTLEDVFLRRTGRRFWKEGG